MQMSQVFNPRPSSPQKNIFSYLSCRFGTQVTKIRAACTHYFVEVAVMEIGLV